MGLNLQHLSIALIISIFAASPCLAIDVITEDEIIKFLDLEKAYLNKKDLDGYLSMLKEDYVHNDRSGKAIDKTEIRLSIYSSFMASLHVLHKATLKSAQIAADGKSADVTLINDSKYLVESGGVRRVIRSYSESNAKLVLINEEIKYMRSTFVKDL